MTTAVLTPLDQEHESEAFLVHGPEEGPASPLPPKPDLSRGVLPPRGPSLNFEGLLIDYLPVQLSCINPSCTGFDLSVNGPPLLGIIDPSGSQSTSISVDSYYGQDICTEMIDPESQVAEGSKLLETDYWSLLWANNVSANSPFEIDNQITHGVTETETTVLTVTVGATLGGMAKLAGLSASLSESFTHTVTIVDQQQVTYKFTWPAKPTPTWVGVYQLMQSFSVIPGSNFTSYIAQANAFYRNLANDPFNPIAAAVSGLHFASGTTTFPYPTPSFLQVVASPPRYPNAAYVEASNMDLKQIQKLVQNSHA
jgi:hypothetical protein